MTSAVAAAAALVVASTPFLTRQALAADVLLGAGVGTRGSVFINKSSNDPAAHKIQYLAKHPLVVFTAGGGATDDPLANGAEAVVFSATDCQCLTLEPAPTVLPGWTQAPASGTPKKYRRASRLRADRYGAEARLARRTWRAECDR